MGKTEISISPQTNVDMEQIRELLPLMFTPFRTY